MPPDTCLLQILGILWLHISWQFQSDFTDKVKSSHTGSFCVYLPCLDKPSYSSRPRQDRLDKAEKEHLLTVPHKHFSGLFMVIDITFQIGYNDNATKLGIKHIFWQVWLVDVLRMPCYTFHRDQIEEDHYEKGIEDHSNRYRLPFNTWYSNRPTFEVNVIKLTIIGKNTGVCSRDSGILLFNLGLERHDKQTDQKICL